MDDFTLNRPQATYTYGNPKKRSPIRFIAIVLILLGIIIFLVNLFLRVSQEEVKTGVMTPTPTSFIFPTDTPTPMPSPTSSISTPSATPRASTRNTLVVEVQNGSGEAGAASGMSNLLKSLGYKVLKIGNAPTFDFEDVTIMIKASKSSFLDLLEKDISKEYTIGSTSAALSATSSADAVVIVGK